MTQSNGIAAASPSDFASKFSNPRIPWLPTVGGSYYITNARVIDTTAGELLPGTQVVRIDRGWITSVASTSASTALDATLPAHDIGGAFLSPGLIDAHVHVTAVPGVETMADMVRLPDQAVTLRATYVLRSMLQRGFTTVRDTGGASRILADALAEGLIEGPRLFQCGRALSQTGGHGDFVAPGSASAGSSSCCGGHALSLGRTADGVPAVLKAVREEIKEGADFIKVMLGGGVASEADAIETVQYTAAEVQAITTTAWQMGKKLVTAHAYTVDAIRHAIDNGVRGIEHGNLIDAPTAKLMAEKEVYLTPTLSCYGIMVREPFERFLNAEGRAKSAEVMKEGLNALKVGFVKVGGLQRLKQKIADEAGVTVCYGSDLLISMHVCQTEEFTIRSAILPAHTILKHATVNPARMLGQEGRLGVVASGAIADLLILEANPLDDITILDRPEKMLRAVIQGGKIVCGVL